MESFSAANFRSLIEWWSRRTKNKFLVIHIYILALASKARNIFLIMYIEWEKEKNIFVHWDMFINFYNLFVLLLNLSLIDVCEVRREVTNTWTRLTNISDCDDLEDEEGDAECDETGEDAGDAAEVTEWTTEGSLWNGNLGLDQLHCLRMVSMSIAGVTLVWTIVTLLQTINLKNLNICKLNESRI